MERVEVLTGYKENLFSLKTNLALASCTDIVQPVSFEIALTRTNWPKL